VPPIATLGNRELPMTAASRDPDLSRSRSSTSAPVRGLSVTRLDEERRREEPSLRSSARCGAAGVSRRPEAQGRPGQHARGLPAVMSGRARRLGKSARDEEQRVIDWISGLDATVATLASVCTAHCCWQGGSPGRQAVHDALEVAGLAAELFPGQP